MVRRYGGHQGGVSYMQGADAVTDRDRPHTLARRGDLSGDLFEGLLGSGMGRVLEAW